MVSSLKGKSVKAQPAAPAVPAAPVSNIVLVQHVEECLKLLEQVAAIVSDGGQPLTPYERMSSVKLRKGGEKIVPVLASLATRFGVSVSSHPVDVMTEKLGLVQTLLPLLQRSEELLKQIEDVSTRANAVAARSASVYYTTLRSLARSNGNVAKSLKGVEKFFGYRHKSTKPTPKKSSKKSAASSGTEPTAPAVAQGAVPATAPAAANGHAQ